MIDKENGPLGTDGDPEDDELVYDIELDEELDVSPEEALQEAVEAVEARKRRTDPGDALSAAGDDGRSSSQNDSLGALEREVEELRDRSIRTLADFENYRRRVERERDEQRRFAAAEAMEAFLEVVDNLERALAAEGSEVDLRLGVKMIQKQMVELLSKFGVEPVSAAGELFDPSVHEAVARVEDPALDAPTVVDEFQRGYRMHDRLLRPARVRVAVPSKQQDDGTEEATDSRDGVATNGAES